MKEENIVTDEEIEIAWGNANFGKSVTKREVLRNGVLKAGAGYMTGHTLECILRDLGLVHKNAFKLTTKGKQYLFYSLSEGNSF